MYCCLRPELRVWCAPWTQRSSLRLCQPFKTSWTHCWISRWSIWLEDSTLGCKTPEYFDPVSYISFLFFLSFLQPNSNELTNGVINTAFMLLFKDSIRLFAAYNEGVINMLGKPHTAQSRYIIYAPIYVWCWDHRSVAWLAACRLQVWACQAGAEHDRDVTQTFLKNGKINFCSPSEDHLFFL